MLAQMANVAPANARAYHAAGMADVEGFLAMGLRRKYSSTAGRGPRLRARVRCAGETRRTGAPQALPLDSDRSVPWSTLLWANARIDLP
jgi:hypothetical protein